MILDVKFYRHFIHSMHQITGRYFLKVTIAPLGKTSFVLDENPASSFRVKFVGCVSIVLKLAIDSIKENKKSLNVFSSASNV